MSYYWQWMDSFNQTAGLRLDFLPRDAL